MISLPQDDFRHTGHIGYDGTTFGDVAFIKQQIEPGDAVRPSSKLAIFALNCQKGLSSRHAPYLTLEFYEDPFEYMNFLMSRSLPSVMFR